MCPSENEGKDGGDGCRQGGMEGNVKGTSEHPAGQAVHRKKKVPEVSDLPVLMTHYLLPKRANEDIEGAPVG